jgi:type IV pilus assembly protein PilQ
MSFNGSTLPRITLPSESIRSGERFSLTLDSMSGLKARILAVAICAMGLTSCAVKREVTPEMTASDSTTPAVVEQTQMAAPVVETLSTQTASTLGIEKIMAAGSTTYEISTPVAPSEVESFTVASPNRFVIDLKGVQGLNLSSLPVSGDSNVKTIRTGKRDDGTRLVFDLTDSAVTPVLEQMDGGVRVVFNSLERASSSITSSTAPTLIKESASQEGSLVTASSMIFEKSPNEPGKVMLTLSGSPKTTLKQAAQTEYVLTLQNTKMSGDIVSPQIAQPGIVKGLRVVRATQDGADVKLRMFVDAGTTLKTVPSANGLMVAALPPAGGEARAQLADETREEVKVAEADDDTARRNPTGIPSSDGSKTYLGRLISLDLQETDIDNALRIIAEVSNLNIIASDDVTGKVTLRLIDVPWDQALDVILKTNGLDQVTEGNVIRIAPVDKLRQEREALREAKKAAENLEDLKVKYIRVSYARAADLKEQVESVLSERGSVSVDERTNQLIVKDIQKGHEETLQLIKKLDLRTPQVLLETQIVEASRNLLRDLGFQWNFNYSASPQTGNAPSSVFPNTVVAGGAAASQTGLQAINFPAAVSETTGAGIAAILDSADGSRALAFRLTALEQEGKVRVLSRPQVATVNNKEAEIKSVETVRIRLPNAGLAVATGQGANAAGAGAAAVQAIDVGIILRVTPQASPDYFVLLDVHAESSTFSGERVAEIPNTLERTATSTILVKSGQTFALGGVYRVNDRDSLDGLPFFKDIPVLGTLFRRSYMEKQDEELIFFITPHIVEGSFDPSLM